MLFLLAGARRTGTTLLNAVACADPAVNPLVAEAQLLTRMTETYRWGKDHFQRFIADYFAAPEDFRHFYSGLVARFLEHAQQRFAPARHLVLKNPELSLVAQELAELCPRAHFIISVRDPRDQVVSELDTGLRQLERGGVNEAAAQRAIGQLAAAYNRYYQPILEACRHQPERFLFVRYEDLVLRTEETVQRIGASTGLRLAAFDHNEDWPRVNLDWETVRDLPSFTPFYGKKIDSSRVGRHREALSAEEVREIESICGELMTRFDYAR